MHVPCGPCVRRAGTQLAAVVHSTRLLCGCSWLKGHGRVPHTRRACSAASQPLASLPQRGTQTNILEKCIYYWKNRAALGAQNSGCPHNPGTHLLWVQRHSRVAHAQRAVDGAAQPAQNFNATQARVWNVVARLAVGGVYILWRWQRRRTEGGWGSGEGARRDQPAADSRVGRWLQQQQQQVLGWQAEAVRAWGIPWPAQQPARPAPARPPTYCPPLPLPAAQT